MPGDESGEYEPRNVVEGPGHAKMGLSDSCDAGYLGSSRIGVPIRVACAYASFIIQVELANMLGRGIKATPSWDVASFG